MLRNSSKQSGESMYRIDKGHDKGHDVGPGSWKQWISPANSGVGLSAAELERKFTRDR